MAIYAFLSYNCDKEATHCLYISGQHKRCRQELQGGSRPAPCSDLTQSELAARSGVTWSSLKRFEREGLIALDSLLNLALVSMSGRFDKLAAEKPTQLSRSIARRPAGQADAAARSDGQKRTQPWHIVRQSC